MDSKIYSLAFCFVIWAIIYVLSSKLRSRKSARVPPGPYPFPIIGNILQLGRMPHQSFAELAKTYGSLMSLKMGSRTTIVVSSPTIAKEVLQKHDQILSSRTVPSAVQIFGHHKISMSWLPASSTQWRNLRKLCKEQMFTLQKLDASQGLRKEKLQELWDYVHKCSVTRQSINVGEIAFTTTLNLISKTLFSLDFANYDSKSSQELRETVWGVLNVVGTPNPTDYFPFLKLLDPKGLIRRNKIYFQKLFGIFDDIIDQRLLARDTSDGNSSSKNDLLEALLDHSMKNEPQFSRNDLKSLLLDLFVAGIDTSSNTVEWVIAELLCNPETMAKARSELKEVIGQKKMIEESDISRLPYLKAVVKETFRLRPVGPLLVPHKAELDVEINGYIVPKNAEILVNVWAMGRDSSIWSNPDMFVPERFLHSEIDVRGNNFELIPFGSGRRICPGLPLAYRMVHLIVASLIHSFDLKFDDGMKPEDLDMSEAFGITIQKSVPLKVVPVSCSCDLHPKNAW